MHELDHAAGLFDMYKVKYLDYKDYVMGEPWKQTAIPDTDIDYIRDVYRNHTPHPTPQS